MGLLLVMFGWREYRLINIEAHAEKKLKGICVEMYRRSRDQGYAVRICE
jgi:hypothetical protein